METSMWFSVVLTLVGLLVISLMSKKQWRYRALKAERRNRKLWRAVREHYSQRGHDRCWMDDEILYREANLIVNRRDFKLPPLPEWRENCEKHCEAYWRDRQPPKITFVSLPVFPRKEC
jgi:hypothetical protein